jgi:hypothetical protein
MRIEIGEDGAEGRCTLGHAYEARRCTATAA